MGKKYYLTLLCAVLVCCCIPLVIYFTQAPSKKTEIIKDTVYEFVQVSHPIQPIPQLKSVNKDLALLGKALFHSPLLSKDNTISCASCHLLSYGGDDGFPVSSGIDNHKGLRNAPTVLNAVFNFRQFWDGRAASLEEQVTGPIHNPLEMGTNWPQVIEKLSDDHYFAKAFRQLGEPQITPKKIMAAIATFEQTLITPNAPIDKFISGDITALSTQQKRGLTLFMDYGCASCHQGVNIGGNLFQKFGRITGIADDLLEDLGRYSLTSHESDKHVFKVPSLRNIAQTAPYFHNGSVSTLPEAVAIMAHSQLGRELSQSEIDDLVALLQAFSGELVELN